MEERERGCGYKVSGFFLGKHRSNRRVAKGLVTLIYQDKGVLGWRSGHLELSHVYAQVNNMAGVSSHVYYITRPSQAYFQLLFPRDWMIDLYLSSKCLGNHLPPHKPPHQIRRRTFKRHTRNRRRNSRRISLRSRHITNRCNSHIRFRMRRCCRPIRFIRPRQRLRSSSHI